MSEYFYYASCSCGMMYSWKEAVDIPEKDFCCSCCGRKVIEYIDAEDRDIDYVGLDREVFDELMTDIRAYLGL
jgi:transcription initiation factor IIE alpha subunit